MQNSIGVRKSMHYRIIRAIRARQPKAEQDTVHDYVMGSNNREAEEGAILGTILIEGSLKGRAVLIK